MAPVVARPPFAQRETETPEKNSIYSGIKKNALCKAEGKPRLLERKKGFRAGRTVKNLRTTNDHRGIGMTPRNPRSDKKASCCLVEPGEKKGTDWRGKKQNRTEGGGGVRRLTLGGVWTQAQNNLPRGQR